MSTEFNAKVENEFQDELYALYKKTRDELYYPATFWVALGQKDWLTHIKNFIGKGSNSDGIKKLINARRPDLSFEYLIVNNEKYHPLFEEELEYCKKTLAFMEKCIKEGITL